MSSAITPATASIATSAVGQSTLDAAKAQRLTKAAHQFEAMLLGEMLKPLGKTDEEAVSGADSSGSNPLQSFGVEAVAGSLANSGALGFAKQIEAALLAHRGASAATTETTADAVEKNSTEVRNQP